MAASIFTKVSELAPDAATGGKVKSKVKNQGDVEKQFNQQADLQIVYNVSPESSRSGKSKRDDKGKGTPGEEPKSGARALAFEDPTQSCPSRPVALARLHVEISAQVLDDVQRHHVAVLSSFQSEVSLAAAYTLTEHANFAGYEKRALLLGSPRNRARDDLGIDLFTHAGYLDKKRQVVLVDVVRKGYFLDSLLDITSDLTRASDIRDNLARRQVFVIVSVRSDFMDLAPDQRLSRASFCHWPVPFLSILLRSHFTSSRAHEMETMLRQQVARGWYRDQAEMYRDATSLLLESPSKLEAVIERRAQAGAEPVSLAASGGATASPLDRLTAGRPGLLGTLLFAGVYLPDLAPQEWNGIVTRLLGDQTAELEEEVQYIDDKGEPRSRKQKVEHKLAALWADSSDQLLEQACLRAVSRPGGGQVIDFDGPHLRSQLRFALGTRLPIFLAANVDRLQHAGLLFSTAVSPALVDNLIQIAVERMVAAPALVDSASGGQRWLLSVVAELRREAGAAASGSEDAVAALLTVVATIDDEPLLRRLYDRLAQLIREMLDQPVLLDAVKGLCNSLLAGGPQQETARSLILELAKRLRFVTSFDAMHWLRRLLDEGSEELRGRTQSYLLHLAVNSGARIFDVLDTVRAWLPEEAQSSAGHSPANRLALIFAAEIADRLLNAVPPSSFGEWPSRCALFAALPVHADQVKDRMEKFVGWLTNRAAPAAIAAQLDLPAGAAAPELDQAYLEFLGDVVESCVLVLEGLEPGAAHPEAQAVAVALLDAVACHLERPRLRRLIRHWQDKQQWYCSELAVCEGTVREERRNLLGRRKNLLNLVRRLGQAAAGTPRHARKEAL
jgi:Arc/MetJ-type ribon-helix-helix transcriptional regulator